MPALEFEGKTLECHHGETIKKALNRHQLSPHRQGSQFLHCPSIGTCGTCAVKVEGKVSEMTPIEKWRMGFPPHSLISKLRLACQTKVLGDVRIEKKEGFWGHQVSNPEEDKA